GEVNWGMWGRFLEGMKLGVGGGLYVGLVKSRGFEFPEPMMGWTTLSPGIAKGRVSVQNERPFNESNSRYLRVESEGNGLFGVANEGFRGMGVRQNETYHFSMRARVGAGSPAVRVELYSSQGALLDTATLKNFSDDWKKYTADLHPNATDSRARLYLLVDGKGSMDFDLVSLFPEHTWKNRPGGLRADMV